MDRDSECRLLTFALLKGVGGGGEVVRGEEAYGFCAHENV